MFLWIFQVVFLNTYYEWYKTKEVKSTSSKVATVFFSDDYVNKLDQIAHDEGVCIEVIANEKPVYFSNSFNKGCMTFGFSLSPFQTEFIESGLSSKTYQTINPRYNNQSLIYAQKLDDTSYAFITASLVPLDATIVVLKNQFVYVTIIVLALSFLMAYFISRKISHPIVAINETAKEMGNGNYQITFQTNEDIEEINNLAKTLNYAKDELAKTEELRRDLMANVSHDLKTPLTMIKAYAEMVRDLTFANEEKRNQNLNTIIDETDRLNTLVNDILTLSSIQANTTSLNLETFDLSKLIKTVFKRYDILREQEEYQFHYEGPKKINVTADLKRMEQVLYNLINNAINYTGDNKEVTVRITDETNHIRVEVVDTGKGIDPKEIDHIWDKYYHSDKNHKRNVIGTGLGLSIVKSILENHHCRYGVETQKKCGTVFYFEIPKEVK